MRSKRLFTLTPTLGACLFAVLLSTNLSAHATSWPTKPISLIVPFPAGGTTDVLARALGDELSQSLGQAVIVENKPGAGATLGATFVARSPADGYRLLMGAVHHTIATSVYPKLAYNFEEDFAPITTVALVPNVLVINADTPAQSLNDLIAMAQQQAGKLSYGSNGYGTAQHLIGTQFQQLTNTDILHVPYRGSSPLVTDLVGKQIDMSFDTVTPVLPHIKSGALKPLAVTTAQRSTALPNTPTLQELGLTGFNIGTWFGVLAPKETPEPILEKLNSEMIKIIQSPKFASRMQEIGAEPVGNSRQAMQEQIATETQKFAQLVREGNVQME